MMGITATWPVARRRSGSDATGRTRTGEGSAARIFAFALIIDLGLVLLYLADSLTGLALGRATGFAAMGPPWGVVSVMINLGGEQNLPAWYSSAKLAAVGAGFGLLAAIGAGGASWATRRALALWASAFLLLSFDEFAMLHERVGDFSRASAPTWRPFQGYGSWALLLAPPALLAAAALWWGSRQFFEDRKVERRLMLLGGATFLISATCLEQLGGVLAGTNLARIQVAAEELGEMLGVSILLYATARLLGPHLRVSAAAHPEDASGHDGSAVGAA